jgi:predicted nucleic acid-binding protein
VKGFLVDTNILSEARKGRRANATVLAWLATHGEDLYLSVLVTGEIRRGIESVRRRDPPSAGSLERWLRALETQFEERILPVDASIADRWGRLMTERTLPVVDGLLAATALVHGLVLATRNARDVARTGVSCVDPFAPAR